MKISLCLCIAIGLIVPTTVRAADDAPVTQPSTTAASADTDIEVEEWVVLVCDPAQSQTNARAVLNNTLPEFIGTRRVNATEKERNDPRPIGVIRLYGPESSALTDVLLEMKSGSFIAHWPRTQPRVNRLLWRNLQIKTDVPTLSPLSEDSWLRALRAGESAYLTTDRGNERFLLYDVELPYKSPIKLEKGGSAESYNVINTSGAPLHDVTVYKPEGEGWRAGSLEEVAAGRSTTKPTTTAATASAASQPDPDSTTQTTSPTTTQATTAASTQPAGVKLNLASADPALMLDRWKQVLTESGLRKTDHELILSILRQQLDPRHATVVFCLDPGELDRLLPIEVVPSPRRISRVALVVVRNSDPALIDEIDALIAQLGDNDWNKREQAYKALADYGASAQPKLNAALKGKDLEIVYRVERLLARLSKPETPQP